MFKYPKTYNIPNGPQIRIYADSKLPKDHYLIVIDECPNDDYKLILDLVKYNGKLSSSFLKDKEGPHLGKEIHFSKLDDKTKKYILNRILEEEEYF